MWWVQCVYHMVFDEISWKVGIPCNISIIMWFISFFPDRQGGTEAVAALKAFWSPLGIFTTYVCCVTLFVCSGPWRYILKRKVSIWAFCVGYSLQYILNTNKLIVTMTLTIFCKHLVNLTAVPDQFYGLSKQVEWRPWWMVASFSMPRRECLALVPKNLTHRLMTAAAGMLA